MIQFLPQVDPWCVTAVIALVQITIVVLLAWVVHHLLRGSPSHQHFVWLTALVAIALTAPLQLVIPAFDVQIGRPMPVLPNQKRIEPARLFLPSLVTTDENGRFTIEGLPIDQSFKLMTNCMRHLMHGENPANRQDYAAEVDAASGDENVTIRIPLKR